MLRSLCELCRRVSICACKALTGGPQLIACQLHFVVCVCQSSFRKGTPAGVERTLLQ